MTLANFHPTVARWFAAHYDTPTPPQADAWPAIKRGEHVLVCAPTGSGKTLAAFLTAIDDLVQRAVGGNLPDQTLVLYVSPLKALSRDIEHNLQAPLSAIDACFRQEGIKLRRIRTGMRTGDTPPSARVAQGKKPPHLLVTTPESLYLLLTSEGGRRIVSQVRTLIIDEIHATLGSKRGAHLSLSVERLDALVRSKGGPPLQRIGLSATQNPIAEVGRFLVGNQSQRRACTIVDHGHGRKLDLAVCLPRSPLSAVMSADAQADVYDQLAALIREHKSTIVFANTRKLTERITRFLAERLGKQSVASHHGSLSKHLREDAELRLRNGQLSALVATASLELGIDIGDVDLVCQIGSPGSVASLLQRVGRSGHATSKTPKGRLFPQSRDDLVECVALLDCIRRGELDRTKMASASLDILAQQLIARLADSECLADDLYALVTRACPYAQLTRKDFDEVVEMVSEGFVTNRGRRGAFIHRDEVTGRLRGRRGARLAALTSGGAIPDSFDYEVRLQPTDIRIGTVNEDFAVESSAGDVFQLGNVSYQIEKIEPGVVRVHDAGGALPNLPFWLGEAPSRTDILSYSVSRLRERVGELLQEGSGEHCAKQLAIECELEPVVALELTEYLDQGRRALGRMPSQTELVAERFFDETGSMHIVLHSSFGMRINRAYALVLRKRFCRSFNVELQAAAGEDSILLSLGPMHSFPLEEIWNYVKRSSAEDVLTQALLDAPLFQTRFRWNATRSLAVLRYAGGKKRPPRFQRMDADDLLALCFPDQVACLENISGDREIPDHPLVRQTITDSLTEAMDVEGLLSLLSNIESGKVHVSAVDVSEPSLFAHEIITAKPYAFLDDAPLEERRAQAVFLRRQGLPESAKDLGELDPVVIERVVSEAEPDPRDPDELHDTLSTYVWAHTSEVARWEHQAGQALLTPLLLAGRVTQVEHQGHVFLTVTRLGKTLRSAFQGEPSSLLECCRGRLELSGPIGTRELAKKMAMPLPLVHAALVSLESEGFVVRGRFRPSSQRRDEEEYCERRLLARIHRGTIGKLRKQIAPVSPAQFLEFLCHHQGLTSSEKRRGPEGTAFTLTQLEGVCLPASSWETSILPARVAGYSSLYLDQLSLTGRIHWRVVGAGTRRMNSKSPVLLSLGNDLVVTEEGARQELPADLSCDARRVANVLEKRGACFFRELVAHCGLLRTQAEIAVSELAARGLCTSDGMGGLRTLIASEAAKRRVANGPGRPRRSRGAPGPLGLDWAGRITLLPPLGGGATALDEEGLEALTWRLLRRWGIVFRRLLTREPELPPWRDLLRTLFRLEARGEIRGGRFISRFSGEQFALPEVVPTLRAIRSSGPSREVIRIAPSDPLNLIGVLTEERLVSRTRRGMLTVVGGQFIGESSRTLAHP